MIRIDNPDEIYKWDTKELWNAINLLDEEDVSNNEEEITMVKYGIKIRIPIIYIIKGWVEEHPENKRVTIRGYGKEDIVKYYDEVDERNKIMRKIIIDNLPDEDPTESRT